MHKATYLLRNSLIHCYTGINGEWDGVNSGGGHVFIRLVHHLNVREQADFSSPYTQIFVSKVCLLICLFLHFDLYSEVKLLLWIVLLSILLISKPAYEFAGQLLLVY